MAIVEEIYNTNIPEGQSMMIALLNFPFNSSIEIKSGMSISIVQDSSCVYLSAVTTQHDYVKALDWITIRSFDTIRISTTWHLGISLYFNPEDHKAKDSIYLRPGKYLNVIAAFSLNDLLSFKAEVSTPDSPGIIIDMALGCYIDITNSEENIRIVGKCRIKLSSATIFQYYTHRARIWYVWCIHRVCKFLRYSCTSTVKNGRFTLNRSTRHLIIPASILLCIASYAILIVTTVYFRLSEFNGIEGCVIGVSFTIFLASGGLWLLFNSEENTDDDIFVLRSVLFYSIVGFAVWSICFLLMVIFSARAQKAYLEVKCINNLLAKLHLITDSRVGAIANKF